MRPLSAILGGEPALTVLPNVLLSGVLTVIIAVAFSIWSVAFMQRPRPMHNVI
jgi:hypothetical protein